MIKDKMTIDAPVQQIIQAVHGLQLNYQYPQKEIIAKLRTFGIEVSPTWMSRVLNGGAVGARRLYRVAEAILQLVENELGWCWEGDQFVENHPENWKAKVIEGIYPEDPSLVIKPGFAFHEYGRLPVSEKVRFIASAQEEVIVFGVMLNTFTTYFNSLSEQEFKSHVVELLKRGVHFKCYLVDPECHQARIYFADLDEARLEKGNYESVIRHTLERLTRLSREFASAGYPGNFSVYKYRHVPYRYMVAIDSKYKGAKLMVTHHIYGESNANCPVIEVTKQGNHILYMRYWRSLQLLMNGAKKVEF